MLIYRQQRPAHVKQTRRITRYVCICVKSENVERKLTFAGNFEVFVTRIFAQIVYFPYADNICHNLMVIV